MFNNYALLESFLVSNSHCHFNKDKLEAHMAIFQDESTITKGSNPHKIDFPGVHATHRALLACRYRASAAALQTLVSVSIGTASARRTSNSNHGEGKKNPWEPRNSKRKERPGRAWPGRKGCGRRGACGPRGTAEVLASRLSAAPFLYPPAALPCSRTRGFLLRSPMEGV